MSTVRRSIISSLAFALIACSPAQQSASTSSTLPDIVATVDGQSITKKDLEDAAAGQMGRLQAQVYQIHKVTLDNLIGDKLVEAAAKKAGKSTEAFMKEEVDSKIAAPSDDELKAFFDGNKAQMSGKSFAEMKDQIRDFLSSSQRRQLEGALAQRLHDAAKIETKIEPPRTKVETGNAPGKGPASASVTIVEFSDFQCPFCGRSRATVKQILDTYGDKVRYVFRDFPLSFHKQATKAHEAAHCAGDQDKYWEMNAKLFESQTALDVAQLKGYAKTFELDQKAFDDCLDSGKYTKQVEADVEYGASVGVSGTPAFFVNGVPLTGARPFADFKQIIDDELKRKGS